MSLFFQGIGDSAQGFANFILYCYSTEVIRRRMLAAIGWKSARVEQTPSTTETTAQRTSYTCRSTTWTFWTRRFL